MFDHMTEMTEPPAEEGSGSAAAPSREADAATGADARPLWGRLNRTNRIAALVLGGVAAALVAALIFGAGLVVGVEFGAPEGDHHGRGDSAEFGEGASDREAGEDTARSRGDETDDRANSAQPQDEEGPDTPPDQAPAATSGAPRPR
jgi:hypothetical protein